jgi:hypothetical protein
MKWITIVVTVLTQVVLNVIRQIRRGPKHTEGDSDGTTEAKMKRKLRKEGWIKVVTFITLIALAGCATSTTVYITQGDAVRLREDVKNVKVWVKTKEGEKLPSVMTLEEGGFYMKLVGEDLKD